MLDTNTRKPVQVIKNSEEGEPYVVLPYSQLPDLENVLKECAIEYEVDEETISLNGEPEEIFVMLKWNTDPVALQRRLDNVP